MNLFSNINKYLDKKNLHIILLSLILIIGFFLRFFHYPNRYGFDFDASRDALISEHAAKNLSFHLIGAGSSLGNFYFGPWYYFQLTIVRILPVLYINWIYVGILSLLTVLVAYKLGEKIENKTLGLIAALLTSISLSQITISTTLSNPSLIPFFAMSSLYLFVKCLRDKYSELNIFIFGLVLGLGISIHYQMIDLLIILPMLWVLIRRKRIIAILLSLFGFVLPFIPLIIYDLTHSFYNIKGLTQLLINPQNNSGITDRWLTYIINFWPSFWARTIGIENIFSLLIIFIGLILGIYLLFKKKLDSTYLYFGIIFIFNFIQFRYFPSGRPIYYLYSLQILVILLTSFAIFMLTKIKFGKELACIILFFIILNLIPKLIFQMHDESSHVAVNEWVSKVLNDYPNQKIAIYTCGDSNLDKSNGMAYLLDSKNLIGASGIPVAIESKSCKVDNKKIILKLKDGDLVELYKNNAINKSGYIYVEPGEIFNKSYQLHKNY